MAAVAIAAAAAGCGGSGDQSGVIEQQTGASSCVPENYEILLRLSNEKLQLYDCVVNGRHICVVEENGIAQDETAVARLVFASSLSGKPACIGGT